MKKLLLLITLLLILGSVLVLKKENYYQLTDAVERINAPDFIWALDQIEPWDQAAVVRDYERRGYKLHCYVPRVEERIASIDDYQCWAIIKSAYQIPAKIIAFGFKEQKLMFVRLEFEDKSNIQLHQYLATQMEKSIRLDSQSAAKFGVDMFNNKLQVWGTQYGIVTTTEFTPGQPNILLWSSFLAYKAITG